MNEDSLPKEPTEEQWKEIFEIRGVETLAELARENGHSIDFSFYPKETFPEDVVIRVPNMNGGDTHFATRAKDEPIGEFFLRVAKERGYIK